MMKVSIFDCLRHTVVPKPNPDPRCQQFYHGYEVGELVRVNHARLVDEICVVVAVVDDIGPGVVPVWSPNFPDALYWKATPREVMRVAVAKKTKYGLQKNGALIHTPGVDTVAMTRIVRRR